MRRLPGSLVGAVAEFLEARDHLTLFVTSTQWRHSIRFFYKHARTVAIDFIAATAMFVDHPPSAFLLPRRSPPPSLLPPRAILCCWHLRQFVRLLLDNFFQRLVHCIVVLLSCFIALLKCCLAILNGRSMSSFSDSFRDTSFCFFDLKYFISFCLFSLSSAQPSPPLLLPAFASLVHSSSNNFHEIAFWNNDQECRHTSNTRWFRTRAFHSFILANCHSLRKLYFIGFNFDLEHELRHTLEQCSNLAFLYYPTINYDQMHTRRFREACSTMQHVSSLSNEELSRWRGKNLCKAILCTITGAHMSNSVHAFWQTKKKDILCVIHFVGMYVSVCVCRCVVVSLCCCGGGVVSR